MKKNPERYKQAAQNRKARHDYLIEETYEAGIVLQGTEVKSLRAGKANIVESYAGEMGGEMWLFGAYIAPYDKGAKVSDHRSRRPRKLLLKKAEINKLIGLIKQKGYTLVPLDIHFTARGFAKVTLGLARGKKQHDKREAIKERDWKREQQRAIKRGE